MPFDPTEPMLFLDQWYGAETRVVTAIGPDDGNIVTRGFAPGDTAALVSFLRESEGHRGLYFQVNMDRRAPGLIFKKGRKEHVGRVVALQADIDLYKYPPNEARERERVVRTTPPGMPGPASAIINSGNGLQAFWLLQDPIDMTEHPDQLAAVECINTAIARSMGGDTTVDVNRIMRIPGTTNLPNRRKRLQGLVAVKSSLVRLDLGLRYRLEDFPTAPRAGGRGQRSRLRIGDAVPIDNLDALDVTNKLKTTIALGAYPGVDRQSRSEWLFSVIISMIRRGQPNEVILGVITDDRWSISDSVLDKPDPDHHARRQIVRAHAWLSEQTRSDFDD